MRDETVDRAGTSTCRTRYGRRPGTARLRAWHGVDDPEVAEALEGLSFTDRRNLDAKGIAAVARFTGAVIPEDDVLDAIEELRQ
ncbi:hypothetical protein [Lentzea sp.]|uniref:hypothetical protein n=1 Tax=Lentzea sp. TaxID=56099 RepID=UPI002C185184|nr:hypothetical protein [Lentzea sp.]HUQ56679.1 hypothetical protein [Lentzea sp.]